MAEPASARLFGLPCGVDYPAELVAGLDARLPHDPAVWARTTLFVNSGRMARRLRTIFDAGPPRLLPRIRLIADLATDPGFPQFPQPIDRLRLQLDLARLLLDLIDRQPGLAPRPAVFDLAERLAALIDEMHGEGVGPEALAALDVGDFAAHWQTGRAIVEAAFTHFGLQDGTLAGAEARRRLVTQALCDRWVRVPPPGPVVIAGSTGSRGATRMLMEAVARLPRGYVVLPGFDFDQPASAWAALDHARGGEDHPQFRFHLLLRTLGIAPSDVGRWTGTPVPVPARNRLVSLALRPVPVTDQWRRDGGALIPELEAAVEAVTLVAAPSQRAEAGAIALRLRGAVEAGRTAALISPDRDLTRRVAAALQRWGIEPDDSAGEPLQQTPPGRLLRQVARARQAPPGLAGLLALLKHPLAASSQGLRGPHLLWTRELELHLRRAAVAFPDGAAITRWAGRRPADTARQAWAAWLAGWLDEAAQAATATVAGHVAHHLALAERLAAGPGATGAGTLWEARPGEAAREAMRDLAAVADAGGSLSVRDYGDLLRTHLGARSVQDPTRPHPAVMVWGTLEARTGGADLAILAGLNDGTWPGLPAPDTWLNRRMRREAGLLSPERSIGLAAHDFQQAIASREVVLTRALRDEDAETVPSRWLNRLTNLLDGLGAPGIAAREGMAARGTALLAQAAALDRPAAPVEPAPRPSPCPPVAARPRALAVTRITQLIRDPYAVYARHILRLRPLQPLTPAADARVRGIALHRIMQAFVAAHTDWAGDPAAARDRLSAIAAKVLEEESPSPAMRSLWHARLMAAADRLIEGEFARLAAGTPVLTETEGGMSLDGLDFRLTARPDRIDRQADGSYAIYDYKSGKPPGADEVRHFEKQLPLEAALLERGGFPPLPAGPVTVLGFISLGASGQDRMLELTEPGGRLADLSWQDLHRLIARYARPRQGYTAKRAAQKMRYEGDFDHLARFGEWDLTDQAVLLPVGPAEAAR